jgi:hypothetical protein
MTLPLVNDLMFKTLKAWHLSSRIKIFLKGEIPGEGAV